MNPSHNQWLEDAVWDVITTAWRQKPRRRSKLSVLHRVFSMPDQEEIENVNSGELNTQPD